MAGLYTIQKNLQKPDYMDGMIQLTKYKTPLLTLLKRGKKPVNWAQEVELEGAITPADLAAQEGADFDESGFAADTTLVMKHQLQMFKSKKGFKVTEESEELPSHNEIGANAALARQIRIDAERTLQSIENTIGSEQEAAERGTDLDTVPRTRGIACWLKPLSTLTAQGAAALHSVQTIPWQACPRYGFSGDVKNATLFNQDVMAEIIRKSALQAGDDDISLLFLCGLSLKALISAWSYKVTTVQGVETTVRNNRDLKDRSISFMCDTYEFDGGVFRAVTDNHLYADIVNSATKMQCIGDVPQWSGVAIKPENWSIDTLVPLKKHMLENKGGGPRGFHKATLRLGCKNPTGQFAVKYVASGSGSSSASSSASSSGSGS